MLELANILDMAEITLKTMISDKNLVELKVKLLLRKTENLHFDPKLENLKLKNKVHRLKFGLVKNPLFFLILKRNRLLS